MLDGVFCKSNSKLEIKIQGQRCMCKRCFIYELWPDDLGRYSATSTVIETVAVHQSRSICFSRALLAFWLIAKTFNVNKMTSPLGSRQYDHRLSQVNVENGKIFTLPPPRYPPKAVSSYLPNAPSPVSELSKCFFLPSAGSER